jgi:hypothetical protein
VAKYVKEEVFENANYNTRAKRSGDSHFWSSLINVKESFLSLGHFQLNNGRNIQF